MGASLLALAKSIYYVEQQQNNNLVWLKRGSGWQSAPLKLKRSAPCTPGFLWANENLPPRCYTHRYGGESCDRFWVKMEVAQTDIG